MADETRALLRLLDGRLDEEERRRLQSRLAVDADLRRRLEALRRIDGDLQRRPSSPLPVDLAEDTMAKIRAAANDDERQMGAWVGPKFPRLAAATFAFGVVIGGLALPRGLETLAGLADRNLTAASAQESHDAFWQDEWDQAFDGSDPAANTLAEAYWWWLTSQAEDAETAPPADGWDPSIQGAS